MIILINGASCTGKTFLAQRILEEFKITYYSIDHIKMGLFRGSKDCAFTPTDSNEKISTALAPILEGMIRTALENKQNLCFEGCYFDEQTIGQLLFEYPKEIIALSLVMTEEYCRNNFEGVIQQNRNAIESRIYEEDRRIEQVIKENQEQKEFAKKTGFNKFEFTYDFESKIQEILDYIHFRLK
jgi:2-phosphoglycerate kinase